MRLEKIGKILDLIQDMSISTSGYGLVDIATKLEVVDVLRNEFEI